MKKIKLISMLAFCSFVLGCTSSCSSKEEPEPIAPVEILKPNGTVRGKVMSNEGDMMTAGIIIIDESNNAYRTCTNEYGGYNLSLAPGKYTLIYTKGFEFSTYTTEIEVGSLKTYYLRDVRLEQLSDAYSKGWIAGDLHQHTIYSDGADDIDQAVIQNAASNIYWGFLTDHDTSRGVPEWREANVNVLTDKEGNRRSYHGFAGSEVTSEFGHFNSLGTGMTFDKYEICFRDNERGTGQKDIAREKMVYIGDQIRRQGGIAQMNHPYSLTNMGSMNYLAETDFELFSHFDTIEVWNAYFTVPDGRFDLKNTDNQNYSSKKLWYSMLNNRETIGKFIPATSGTDSHDATGNAPGSVRNEFHLKTTSPNKYQNFCRYMGKYAGSIATYAYLGNDEINQNNVLDAVSNGHSFLSNGPILDSRVNNGIYGDSVEAIDGKAIFTNDIYCRDGMNEIRVIKNGEIAKTINLDLVKTYNEEISVDVSSNDWVLLEVLGDWGTYAISNPVFIK